MLKILIFLTILYTFSYANAYSKDYLKHIKQQPSISYKTLVDKYIYYVDDFSDGEAISEIDGEFETRYDENLTAIDTSKIKDFELIVASKKYAIAMYDDGFDKYGVIFDANGRVKNVLLLVHSFGNLYFNVERSYDMQISNDVVFYISEIRHDRDARDTLMYFSYKSIYVVTVHNDGSLTKQKASLDEKLIVEDKRLNRYYKKLKNEISKKQRVKLRDIQRAWFRYVDKKCSFLVEKKECLYKAKYLRADELEDLYKNLY